MKKPINSFDKLRGFGLLALYSAFAIFSLMLTFAAFRFWPAASGEYANIKVVALVFFSILSALSAMRAAAYMWVVLRRLPLGSVYIDLMPFLTITLTLTSAGWLFNNF